MKNFLVKNIMNIMKKVVKISSKICGTLLAVLVFSAVLNSCEEIYYADYFIDGKIVSEETETPISGLKVSFTGESFPADHKDKYYTNEFTNESGDFKFVLNGDLVMKYAIKVEDIDGEQNGAFNDTIINVVINHNEFIGGGKRYAGKYYKTLDIKLTPKN